MEHGSRLRRENTSTPPTLPQEISLPVLQKDPPSTSKLRSKPHVPRFPGGSLLLRTRELVTFMPWQGRYKSILAAWPCSKRWTTENQFVRAAISIFRWWRGIFIITRDGHNFWSRSFLATWPAESWDRS